MEYGRGRPSTGRCLATGRAAGRACQGLPGQRCEPLQGSLAFSESPNAVHLQDGRSRSVGIAPDQGSSVYRSLDEAMVLTHRSPCSIENREPTGTMLMIEALRTHN